MHKGKNLTCNGLLLLLFQKTLGTTVSGSLRTSDQCSAAGKKVNRILGIIKKGFDKTQKMSFSHFINPWYTNTFNVVCSSGSLSPKNVTEV